MSDVWPGPWAVPIVLAALAAAAGRLATRHPVPIVLGAAAALAGGLLLHPPPLAAGATGEPAGPARLLELVVPRILDSTRAASSEAAAREGNLLLAGLLGSSTGRWPLGATLYVGLLPLLLSLHGAISGRGLVAWGGRLAAAVGWLAAAGVLPVEAAAAAPVGLGVLAAAGLSALDGRPGPDPVRSPPPDGTVRDLALAVLAVLASGALLLLAARLGGEPDDRLVRRLVGPGGSEVAVAATARIVRSALDQAAAVSFASLVALLLHLRQRSRGTAALVLLVGAGDLALHLAQPGWTAT